MALASADFEYIRKLVYERAAIALDEGKSYLVETRLAPLARTQGFASIEELVIQLRGKVFGRLHKAVVDAMTTNETSFFRDIHPFESLRKEILPEMLKLRATARTLTIWCAASSSGQEPYSIAMILRQDFPQLSTWKVRILATDISSTMIERARAGCFSQLEVNRGLPAPLLVRFFEKDGMTWQIKDEIRKMVEFRELNLKDNFPPLPGVDILFIRNVLIYFDVETKRSVLSKIAKVLKPDGYLFLGGAETTINIDASFSRRTIGKTVCYQKGAEKSVGALAR